MQVLAANVGPDRKLAQNDSIQIAFDRFLLPSTVIRQSFVLVDSFNKAVASPLVAYDPVTRVVTLSNPNTNGDPWLLVDQPYKVVFPVPAGSDDQSGVRAIDRATLDPAVLHQIGFQVAAPRSDLPKETTIRFCRDVLPVLQLRCTQSGCHNTPEGGGSRPVQGLVLATSVGVLNTAINRASVEANTGPLAGPGRAPGRVFGVDMPIVAPGNPSNSWLMYKLLLAPPQDAPQEPVRQERCDGTTGPDPGVPLAPLTSYLPLTADERARLGNKMVGNQMPYPPEPGNPDNKSENLTFDELQRVRAWITQGAVVEECGACAQ